MPPQRTRKRQYNDLLKDLLNFSTVDFVEKRIAYKKEITAATILFSTNNTKSMHHREMEIKSQLDVLHDIIYDNNLKTELWSIHI